MGTIEESVATNAKTKTRVAEKELGASQEQLIYASILDTGMKIGLAGIVVSFIVYVAGILAPKVAVQDVSTYWGMKSEQYLEATGIHSGWSWLGMYNHGDFLNFFPIAFLAGMTIACYIAIVPTLLRKKDNIYAIFAVLEVLILVAAASGLISAGGH